MTCPLEDIHQTSGRLWIVVGAAGEGGGEEVEGCPVGAASLAKETTTQFATAETHIHQRQHTKWIYMLQIHMELLRDDYYRSLAEHTHSSQTAASS